MSVCWMFIILLGCKFSHTALSQSTCNCNEQMKTPCVPVHVPCPNVTADTVNFNLFKDQEVISYAGCNKFNNTLNCLETIKREGVKLQINQQHESVSFLLTGVTDSSYGTYRCDSTITLPPPFRKVPSTLRIQVIAQGHLCNSNQNSSSLYENPSPGFVWIWILVIILVSIYSIIVTIVAFANWVKLRKMDSQSDYMNTKPRAPRERRKKKGVQNPIPRHF
ncbi:T-cell-specific surface glycoprotein CD28 [Seriola aureovittata]|uniref:T-cell-specific surface glycoprotein CD28 n=1 Tax=Seriola aureovittata TaxID=2871759 RepID=UPI0024BEC286|nr:T-cell-specific surface glycoprotein CD28 [Seriola aureovittata]